MGGDLAIVLTIVCTLLGPILADYPCICNYNVEKPIFQSKSEQGQAIGYMYEFDCKAQLGKESGDWMSIAFEHQVGYIKKDGQIMVQVCAGSPPDEDVVTTTPAPVTTTLLATSTTIAPTSQALLTDSTTVTTRLSTKLSTATKAQQTTPSSTTTTTLPSTISTTHSTTASTRLTTTVTKPATASITQPTSISTTQPTTVSTTQPTTVSSTQPTTVSTTQPTTVSTTQPTTVSTTQPTTASTTQPTTASTTKLTTVSTTQPTTTFTTQPTKASTTQPATVTVSTLKPIHTTQGTVLSCHDLFSDTVNKDNGTLFAYGEKCLELLRIHTTWVNAELECRRKGGHLISIADSNEQRVIYQVINTYYHEAVWIGLHDMHHEEKFEWTSGKSVVYTNWYPGRKDPALHWTEDCVALALNKYSGRWEDRSCKETRGFICQFEKKKVTQPALIG